MIYRVLVPLIAMSLFFMEPMFSLFSPIEWGGRYYTLIPYFFATFLILLTAYDTQKTAYTYAFLFGIIYDMYHIDLIGVYTRSFIRSSSSLRRSSSNASTESFRSC